MRRHLTSIFIAVAFVVAMCPKAGFGAVGDVAELAGVSVVQLVEDPGQPGRVYAATDQGVFVLPDGNSPWHVLANGLAGISVSSVACVPDGSRLMAAAEQGLWELAMGSESWSLVSGSPRGVMCLSVAGTDAGWHLMATTGTSAYLRKSGTQEFTTVGAGLPQTGITCGAVDTWNPSVLYVGTSSGLYVSRDGGQTWILTLSDDVRVAQPDTAFKGVVRIGGARGVFVSTDQGVTWAARSSGLPDAPVAGLEVDPASPGIRYAIVEGCGLWRTVDDAGHWNDDSRGLDSPDPTCFVRMSSAGSLFWMGSAQGAQLFEDTPAQWNRMEIPPDLQSTSLLVHDAASKRLFAATLGAGLWISTDEGGPWKRCGVDFAPSEIGALVVDPKNPERLFAGTPGGLYASNDSGATWTSAAGGLPEVTVRCLAFSPGHSDVIYAGTDSSGLQISVDAGATWSRMKNGITGEFVTNVSPNPANPSDILVLVNNVGVFRTANAGAGFVATNNGIKNLLVRQLARDATDPLRVYLTTAAVTEPGGRIITPAGFYISLDGGSTWSSSSQGLGRDSISSLLAGREYPGLLYLSQQNNGLMVSSDKGLTWKDISNGLRDEDSQLDAFSLVEGVRGEGTILAATVLSGIFAYRSVDFNPVSNLAVTATLDGKPVTCPLNAVLIGATSYPVAALPWGPQETLPGTWSVHVLSGGPQNARMAGAETDVGGVLHAGQTLTLNTVWKTTVPPPPPEPRRVVLVLHIGSSVMNQDGRSVAIDVPPQIVQGRTLLPIKWVAEPLGASVVWSAAERKVTIVLGTAIVELWIGRSTARVNGTTVAIDPQNSGVVPLIVSGRTMLPVRFVAEQLGARVDYDAATRRVTITWPAP
jgi:ligand-binding sensor domain-containing protein